MPKRNGILCLDGGNYLAQEYRHLLGKWRHPSSNRRKKQRRDIESSLVKTLDGCQNVGSGVNTIRSSFVFI